MSAVVRTAAPAASRVRCWSRGVVLHRGRGSGGRGSRLALRAAGLRGLRRERRSPAGADPGKRPTQAKDGPAAL